MNLLFDADCFRQRETNRAKTYENLSSPIHARPPSHWGVQGVRGCIPTLREQYGRLTVSNVVTTAAIWRANA